MKSKSTTKHLTRNSRGSLAEFGPALLLLLVFLLVPTLTLLRLGMAVAAVYFVVDRAADSAAKSPDYDAALRRANETVHSLTDTPLARFSGLQSEDIEQVCLYVDEHVTMTDCVNVLTRDQLLRKTISPEVNTYEYEVRSSFLLRPLLPGCRMPWLGQTPFLCAPTPITVASVRLIEYPDELVSSEEKQL